MPLTRGFAVFLSAAAALCAQSAPNQLTARELFYAATQTPAKAPDAPKTPATPKAPPKSTSKSTPPRSTRTTPKPVEIASAGPQEGGVKVIPASSQTAPMPANGEQPLGLRINVLRYNPDGSTTDVLPQTVFHSGDRIQLRVEPNARGYLYIASQGATGEWSALFPSPSIANGDNRAEAMHPYVIPPDNVEVGRPRVFTFDASAGKEKLFVVFSRRPVPDFEELIYKLKTGQKAADPSPKPKSDKTLIMAANIGDSTIGRLRATARDLIVETVSDAPAPAGEKKDTAIYVVNPSGSSDSSVVADIHLVHQ
jgi:hypothetical protein